MYSNTLKALIETGAIKSVSIVADGATIITTGSGNTQSSTVLKVDINSWSTIDAAVKLVRGLGIGTMKLSETRWQPSQHGML